MPGKSHPGDESLALDLSADEIEREAAIKRLGADCRFELQGEFERLLLDRSPWVRAAAYVVLLVYWRQYAWVSRALCEFDVSSYSSQDEYERFADLREKLAGTLAIVARRLREEERCSMAAVLRRHLLAEDEPYVHRATYVALLDVLGDRKPGERVPSSFRVAHDVDQSRLERLFRRKPSARE